MPINYKSYNKNFKLISENLRNYRANNKCELCDAENKMPHWKTKSKVVLTVHHINFDNKDDNKYNLVVLCQRCHLRLDLYNKLQKRKQNKIKKGVQNEQLA